MRFIRFNPNARCDMCGKYSTSGVTESAPSIMTIVCVTCILEGAKLVINSMLGKDGESDATS